MSVEPLRLIPCFRLLIGVVNAGLPGKDAPRFSRRLRMSYGMLHCSHFRIRIRMLKVLRNRGSETARMPVLERFWKG
jgi:hypothetical protein